MIGIGPGIGIRVGMQCVDGGAYGPAWRSIVRQGEVSNNLRPTTAPKTRGDHRGAFPVCATVTEIQPVWLGGMITLTGESGGPNALSYLAAAVEFGANHAVSTVGGSATFSIPQDLSVTRGDVLAFPVTTGGTVCARGRADLGTGFVSPGVQTGDQHFTYDPTVSSPNTIDSTGGMSIPAGGGSDQYGGPSYFRALMPGSFKSIIAFQDSRNRSNDFVDTDGAAGGGHLRMSCHDLGVPLMSFGLNGRELRDALAESTMMSGAMSDFSVHWWGLWINDQTVGGRNYAQITGDMLTAWALSRARHARWIVQEIAVTTVTSTDRCTSEASQTPVASCVVGGLRDQIADFVYASLASGLIDAIADYRPILETAANVFKTDPFSTTLPTGCTSSATTITLADAVTRGDMLVASPGGAGGGTMSTGQAKVLTCVADGGGGYTVTINAAFGVAQSAGAIVKKSSAFDALHQETPQHTAQKAVDIAVIEGLT